MKRVFSLLLVLTLILAAFPVTASAVSETAKNIKVNEAKYSATGLFSVTTSFEWAYTGVKNARLILLKDRLKGSYENSGVSGYGDFTDFGDIADKNFKNYADAKAYDDKTNAYGFLAASGNIPSISYGDKKTVVFSGLENAIPLNRDDTYFVYLWVTYSSKFYPDNLICVIQVKDGKLSFTGATRTDEYRNHYDATGTFTKIEDAVVKKGYFDLFVNPGSHMNRIVSSGAEEQLNLTDPIVDIIYKADDGYYFPEDYSILPVQRARMVNNNTVNGISLARAADGSQITLSGKLTDHTKITLPPATKIGGEHTHTPSYDWDRNQHWQVICNTADCADYKKTANPAPHKFDSAYDKDCDCGYTRILTEDNKEVRPEDKPETGDITNIPLWTAIVFAGLALLWVQLEQRKRQQY